MSRGVRHGVGGGLACACVFVCARMPLCCMLLHMPMSLCPSVSLYESSYVQEFGTMAREGRAYSYNLGRLPQARVSPEGQKWGLCSQWGGRDQKAGWGLELAWSRGNKAPGGERVHVS